MTCNLKPGDSSRVLLQRFQMRQRHPRRPAADAFARSRPLIGLDAFEALEGDFQLRQAFASRTG